MSRKANDTRLQKAKNMILSSPGEKSSFYAKKLGIHPYDFNTLLAMLNERGFYLSEDDDGRLRFFDPNQA
jgi:hypothetical protein